MAETSNGASGVPVSTPGRSPTSPNAASAAAQADTTPITRNFIILSMP